LPANNNNCCALNSACFSVAEVVGEYLKKGSKIYVEGALQTRKWQDQSGQDRYTTEIKGSTMQMLDSRGGAGGGGSAEFAPAPQQNRGRSDNFASAPAPALMDDFDAYFHFR